MSETMYGFHPFFSVQLHACLILLQYASKTNDEPNEKPQLSEHHHPHIPRHIWNI